MRGGSQAHTLVRRTHLFFCSVNPSAVFEFRYSTFSVMPNYTYATAISRSSSVSCWLQHRRPFVDSDFDHGVVQRMALGALAWAHDFEKAFDTVEHDVLWEVLKDQGLHPDYIDIIKRLYGGQTAYVQAGAASRRFPLLRGVKQGDPVSALLFIAVMEQCFRSLKKNAGKVQIGGDLVNISVLSLMTQKVHSPIYASHTTFFCLRIQVPDLTKMISHVREEAAKYGLRMHLGKTKILSNIPPEERPDSLTVGTTSIEVFEGRSRRKISWKEAYS